MPKDNERDVQMTPDYVKNKILANAYPGETRDTTNIDVWNLLVVPVDADENLVYQITKMMFEKKDELVRVHKDASFSGAATPESFLKGSMAPRPYRPGRQGSRQASPEGRRPASSGPSSWAKCLRRRALGRARG